MSRGVNKVILVGNLGADPELRQTNSGFSVCNMRIVTNDWRRDNATQERVETSEWHNIVLFKRLAEVAERYLRKGSQVYIEGKLRTRKWQDREGNNRYSTEVIAEEMQMLGPRSEGSHEHRREGSHESRREGNYASESSRNAQGNRQNATQAGADGNDEFDDDIPF